MVDLFEDNFDMGMDYLAVLASRLLEVMEATSAPDEASLQLVSGCDDDETSARRRDAEGAATD